MTQRLIRCICRLVGHSKHRLAENDPAEMFGASIEVCRRCSAVWFGGKRVP